MATSKANLQKAYDELVEASRGALESIQPELDAIIAKLEQTREAMPVGAVRLTTADQYLESWYSQFTSIRASLQQQVAQYQAPPGTLASDII